MGRSIAIFSALYLPSYGGVEQFSANLATELAGQGHDVCVVTCDIAGLGPHERTDAGFDVFRLPCHSFVGGRFQLPRRGGAYRAVWRDLAARPCDGVLVNTRFYPHSVAGLRYAREKGLRAVMLDHGSSYLAFGDARIDWAVRRYEDLATLRVRRFHPAFYGISDKSLAWLGNFGIQGEGVIHNAIDAPAFRALSSGRDFRGELGLAPDAPLISFTGRLVPDKGTACLVEMARLLDGHGCGAHVLVAGDGPERAAMERAGVPNLHLLGRLEKPDVSALLAASDAFVLPSKTEGLPTSVLEAAASGVASVTTDVGGVHEIMPDERYGAIVPAADPAAFADILEGYLTDRAALRDRGSRCRERVERLFSWRQTAEDVLRACELAQESVGV